MAEVKEQKPVSGDVTQKDESDCRISGDKVWELDVILGVMRSQSQGVSWAVTCFDFLFKKVLLSCCWGPFGAGQRQGQKQEHQA